MTHLSTPRVIAFVLTVALSSGIHALGSSNKWRIEVSEGANSDGAIVFDVLVGGYDTRTVTTDIEDGYSENHVARVIANAFHDQLPREAFHVEVDDGEDVLVKARGDIRSFELRLRDNAVRGVRINLDRE